MNEAARKLRINATDAERKLWRKLRELRPSGSHFRRQVQIGAFIVDFACMKAKTVVEVDGGQHAESEQDKVRDRFLIANGYRVLRFWNSEVMQNLDGVMQVIAEFVPVSHPHPSPPRKGEGT